MRSVENKLIQVPCNVGMNQGPDAEFAPPGTFTSVRNMRIKGHGLLEKRAGTKGYAGTVSAASSPAIVGNGTSSFQNNPQFVGMVGDAEVISSTSGAVWARDNNTFFYQGRAPTTKPVKQRFGIISPTAGASGPQFASDRCSSVCVNSNGDVLVSAIGNSADNDLRIYIESPEGVRKFAVPDGSGDLSDVARVRFVAVGTTFFGLVQPTGAATISYLIFSAVGDTYVADYSGSFFTMQASVCFFDISAYDSTTCFVVYQNATSQLTVVRIVNGSPTHTATLSAANAIHPVSIWADPRGGNVWVGWYNDPTGTGSVRYAVFGAAALAVVLAATTIVTAVNIYGPPLFGGDPIDGSPSVFTQALAFFRRTLSTGNTTRAVGVVSINTTGVVGTPTYCWNMLPISKPDNYGRIWCAIDNASTNLLLSRVALLRFVSSNVNPDVVVEVSSPLYPAYYSRSGFSSTLGFYDYGFFSAQAVGASSSFYGIPYVLQTLEDVTKTFPSVAVYEYQTGEQNPHLDFQELGRYGMVAGQPTDLFGTPFGDQSNNGSTVTGNAYSGCSEIGFVHGPLITASTTNNGAAGFTVGSYSFIATYEWADQYGRRHRSTPSNNLQITLSATASSIDLAVTALNASQRQAPYNRCVIAIYRTLVNGVNHHLVGYFDSTDSSDGIITCSITQADSAIDSNEFLYTDGGVLANVLAPSCRFVCKAEDRVWCGGLWDPSIIECSKIIVPGEPVQFTGDPSHQVALLGDCTGLAYMDGFVVAFTRNTVVLIGGDGPNDQGAGSFPPPRTLASDVGCVDYRSILETQAGVFFQSKIGLYLIPKGFGTPLYVGEAVRDEIASYPQVLSACTAQTAGGHLARWLVTTAAGTTGAEVINYDLISGQWTVDVFNAALTFGEIGVWSDGFVYVKRTLSTTSNPILVEDWSTPAIGDDNNGGNYYVSQGVDSAWIYPFGVGGYGALNTALLSTSPYASPTGSPTGSGWGNNRAFSVYTDNSTPVRAAVWTGFPSNMSTGSQKFMQVTPAVKQGTRFKLSYADSQFSSNTPERGVKLIGFTLEAESSNGIRLITAAERQ